MTITEKQAWLSLMLGGLLMVYLVANLVSGWSIPDQATRHLWRTWWILLGVETVGEWALYAWCKSRRKQGELEGERDLVIKLRAERIGSLVAFGGLQALILQLLWERTIPNHILPHIDMTHVPTLFFLLFLLLLIGRLTKDAATIILGRL
jgi:hypothetical protein